MSRMRISLLPMAAFFMGQVLALTMLSARLLMELRLYLLQVSAMTLKRMVKILLVVACKALLAVIVALAVMYHTLLGWVNKVPVIA
ncbi:Uncharacterised protein [Serratia fonticola]|nr:Uncharacterised protein [Serratia fonticola]CAI1788265.1 Uncharacterised protein [Serratia fonticola]CAI1852003.1 Uncharacterised protein [Serratia fonticola]